MTEDSAAAVAAEPASTDRVVALRAPQEELETHRAVTVVVWQEERVVSLASGGLKIWPDSLEALRLLN